MSHPPRARLALFAAFLLAAGGCVSSHPYQPYDDPYQQPYDDRGDPRVAPPPDGYAGDRAYDLRSIAAELQDRARNLARVAARRDGRRGRVAEEVVELSRDLAGRASDLVERLQDRRRLDVRRDVEKLNEIARELDGRIRSGRLPEEAHQEWNGVAQTLARLNEAAGGRVFDDRRRPGEVYPRDYR